MNQVRGSRSRKSDKKIRTGADVYLLGRLMTAQPYVLKWHRWHSGDVTIRIAEVGGTGVFVHDCVDHPSARWSRGNESLEAAQSEADAVLVATGHRCDEHCRPWTRHTAVRGQGQSATANDLGFAFCCFGHVQLATVHPGFVPRNGPRRRSGGDVVCAMLSTRQDPSRLSDLLLWRGQSRMRVSGAAHRRHQCPAWTRDRRRITR